MLGHEPDPTQLVAPGGPGGPWLEPMHLRPPYGETRRLLSSWEGGRARALQGPRELTSLVGPGWCPSIQGCHVEKQGGCLVFCGEWVTSPCKNTKQSPGFSTWRPWMLGHQPGPMRLKSPWGPWRALARAPASRAPIWRGWETV